MTRDERTEADIEAIKRLLSAVIASIDGESFRVALSHSLRHHDANGLYAEMTDEQTAHVTTVLSAVSRMPA